MKNLFKSNPGKETILFLLLVISAFFFYLYKINFSDIWTDEAFTKALVKHSFKDVIGLLINDYHPPFYFLALKLFTLVAGVSNFSIRFFSLIGAVCTLIIAYVKGQKVFGKTGALYFSLLIFTIPMLASYSHDARMYTWAAFLITGVFLYSVLFIRSGNKRDLVFLGLFSLMAAYIHYYSLIAIFWANLFVFIYLLVKKNKSWKSHFIMIFLLIVLYLPWLFVMFSQTGEAQKDFWIQPMTWQTIKSCYIDPFAMKFSIVRTSFPLILMVYGLTVIVIINNVRRKTHEGLSLALSLVIYHATLITIAVISLTIRPLMFSRYVMTMVTMLMVPPAIFFIQSKKKILNGALLFLLFGFGIYTSTGSAYFSFGPYRQCMQLLRDKYPEVKKVVHVVEVTTGPLMDHNEIGNWQHYWLNSTKAISYTNLDVFDDLARVNNFDPVLTRDEMFCLVDFRYLPLNNEHRDSILSCYQLVSSDTIRDNKMDKLAVELIFYMLQSKNDTVQ